MIVPAVGFSQSSFVVSLDSLNYQPAIFMTDGLKPLTSSPFLEIAARNYRIDLTTPPAARVQRSIMAYDLKPLPDKPYFDLSDRNNFERIYKTNNLAFYESLKNTAVSQLYNPFSVYKQL